MIWEKSRLRKGYSRSNSEDNRGKAQSCLFGVFRVAESYTDHMDVSANNLKVYDSDSFVLTPTSCLRMAV